MSAATSEEERATTPAAGSLGSNRGAPAAGGSAAAEMSPRGSPEDVDLQNRWAELENEAAAVEAKRGEVEAEAAKLRALQADARRPEPDRVEGAEVQALRGDLAAARQECERLLQERAAEKAQRERLSQELERQSADLSKLSAERFKCLHERNLAESRLLPAEEALAQSRREQDGAQRLADEARARLSEAEGQRSGLLRERAALQRSLALQVETLEADITLHKRIAEDAREAEKAARRQAAVSQQRLLERTKAFAAERATLQGQMELRNEELVRERQQREEAQQQLADALRERDADAKSHSAATAEAEELRREVATLRGDLSRLERESEDLLRQRLPGSDTALPEGVAGLAELLRGAAAAKEEAAKERRAREQAQELLRDASREVRVRLTALAARGEEAERLHGLADELLQENEGLLARVERLRTGRQAAEKRALKAEASNRILEGHFLALQRQLAVLVHENHKLGGKTPGQPAVGVNLQALESDRSYFRSVEELTRQNVALRMSIARLTSEREEPLLKVADEEKGEEAVPKDPGPGTQRQDRPRDAGLAEKPALPKPPAVDAERRPEAEPEPPIFADLAAFREDFARSLEARTLEAEELRASELRARQELARAQRQLDHEVESRSGLEEKLRRLEAALQEGKARAGGAGGAAASGSTGAAIGQESPALERALREKEHFMMQAELARQKAAALEQSNTRLAAEKASQAQLLQGLEAQTEHESGCYREARRALEESYRSKETLWQQQLELYKASVAELRAASSSKAAEASEAASRADSLEATVADLTAQLARREEKTGEPRAAGSTKPSQSGALDASSASELAPSSSSKDHDAKVGKLQEQLRRAEEKVETYAKNAKLWESLVQAHEADLKAKREENQGLDQQLAAAVEQRTELQQEVAAAREKASSLEARVQELSAAAKGLRSELGAKDELVIAARREGEKRVQEAVKRLEVVERESSGSREVSKRWQQSFHEEVEAHKKDIEDLSEAKGRCSSLERELEELRHHCHDLTAERDQVRTEREDEMQTLRWRLQRAESHAEGLVSEASKCQAHLLALVEQQLTATGASEPLSQIAAELRRAGATGERRCLELELGLASREREAAALRAEAAELRQRLDSEHRALQDLQEQIHKQDGESAKLCQFQHIMCEKRQQAARILEMEANEHELRKDLSAEKAKVAPLQERVGGLLLKETEAAKERRKLEAKADEWKRLHDEVVLKLQTHDVNELKRLREESARWQAQRAELQSRVERLQEDLRQRQEELRQRGQELQASRALKEKHEELQRVSADMNSRIDQLTRAKAQLQESNTKKDSGLKQAELLKTLRDKKISELDRDLKRAEEERQKQQAALERAERAQAQQAAAARKSDEALAKNEEEAKVARQRADRALSVAADYQRALDALLTQGRGAEAHEDPEERERVTREAKPSLDREVREPGQGEVGEREELSRASSAGGEAAISGTAASTSVSAVLPAAQTQVQAASGGADGAAGVKRKACSAEVASVSASVSASSTTVGATEGDPRLAKAVRTAAPGDGIGGAAAVPQGASSREADGGHGAQSGRRVATAVKAGALAVQASLWGTSAAASSSGAGVSGIGGLGTKAAASAAAPARGVGMVVDLEEGEQESAPA